MWCSGLVVTAVTILGLCLGAIIRNAAGAITALAALTVVIPSILTALPDPWGYEIGRYTFIGAATQLVKTNPPPHYLNPAQSGLVILGYIAAALLLAALAITRRDA